MGIVLSDQCYRLGFISVWVMWPGWSDSKQPASGSVRVGVGSHRSRAVSPPAEIRDHIFRCGGHLPIARIKNPEVIEKRVDLLSPGREG
jgi:hypothetical protein